MMPYIGHVLLFSVTQGPRQVTKLTKIRLRLIPEFTDTTDTDTLDLQQHRYRVPIPIPVVTS